MTTWRDIAKGDAVTLKGKRYVVTKLKHDGKRIDVTVIGGAGSFSTTVKAKADVERAERAERWATKKEAKAVLGKMPKGDATVTTPPRKPMGDPWETPRDRVERKLDTLLGAHLVGEATDENAGYYVSPVDITTVAAHLALFHGVDTHEYGIDDLMHMHATQHAEALVYNGKNGDDNVLLHVNHWHTKTRPERPE